MEDHIGGVMIYILVSSVIDHALCEAWCNQPKILIFVFADSLLIRYEQLV